MRKLQRNSDRGQAMVETAIVMPLFIFIILGMIQMTQVYQAQAMLKYAAYRAARDGSINNMNIGRMKKVALVTMLPVNTVGGFVPKLSKTEIAKASMVSSVQQGVLIYPPHKASLISDLIQAAVVLAVGGEEGLKVLICGPVKSWLQNKYYNHINKKGQGEVDFDDPRNTYSGRTASALSSVIYPSNTDPTVVENFERTKLKIQLQYNHRLIIPFVDWVIYKIARGKKVITELRMSKQGPFDMPDIDVDMLGMMGMYVLPMYANYAFRMHSNFMTSNLPTSDDACIGLD